VTATARSKTHASENPHENPEFGRCDRRQLSDSQQLLLETQQLTTPYFRTQRVDREIPEQNNAGRYQVFRRPNDAHRRTITKAAEDPMVQKPNVAITRSYLNGA